MPVVDENRLKGNFGAAYVTSILSSECLVRPVAADTDVGVDLYCETVENASPFLHFWVQVKAGNQCRLSADRQSAACSFSAAHLRYWAAQPVPVFAALVHVEWPVQNAPRIYLIHVSEWLINNSVNERESVTLHSNSFWNPNDRTAVEHFLIDTVPTATAQIAYRNGVLRPVPTATSQYEFATPTGPIAKFEKNILNQIRRTAAFSVLHLFRNDEFTEDTGDFRRALASVVAQFPNDPHWENFMALGLSHHADRNFNDAVQEYARAIECIRNDHHVANLQHWQDRIKSIEKLKNGAMSRMTLGSQLSHELRGPPI